MNKTIPYNDKSRSFYYQKKLLKGLFVVCLKTWFCVYTVYVIRCQVVKSKILVTFHKNY